VSSPTRYFYSLTVAVLCFWGALSNERTGLSLVYAAGPRQWTIFYCLRFETSLFVASYDTQGHGGGIRPLLHTGVSSQSLSDLRLYLRFDKVKVKVTLRLTVSQSVSLGVEPLLGLMTRYLLLFDIYGLVFWGTLSDERSQICQVKSKLHCV
jgi:hypothetical protein